MNMNDLLGHLLGSPPKDTISTCNFIHISTLYLLVNHGIIYFCIIVTPYSRFPILFMFSNMSLLQADPEGILLWLEGSVPSGT